MQRNKRRFNNNYYIILDKIYVRLDAIHIA